MSRAIGGTSYELAHFGNVKELYKLGLVEDKLVDLADGASKRRQLE